MLHIACCHNMLSHVAKTSMTMTQMSPHGMCMYVMPSKSMAWMHVSSIPWHGIMHACILTMPCDDIQDFHLTYSNNYWSKPVKESQEEMGVAWKAWGFMCFQWLLVFQTKEPWLWVYEIFSKIKTHQFQGQVKFSWGCSWSFWALSNRS